MEINSLLAKLQQAVILTHYWHLRTESYARHMALGEFYETLPGLIDALAEAYIGKFGTRPDIPKMITLDKPEDHVAYFQELGMYVDTYVTMYSKHVDIQDLILDIRNLITKTSYLFTLS